MPITVNDGSVSIEGNVINAHVTDAIHVNIHGSAVILSNLLVGQEQYYGVYCEGTVYMSNNNVTNFWTGIYAIGSSNILQNNIMYNLNDGVVSSDSTSTIQYNAIANNTCGLAGTGTIQNNTVTGNVVGIWSPSASANISFNNIFGNVNASSSIVQNIHLTDQNNMTLTNNWWGSVDAFAVNQTIWDYKNDTVNLGTVTFIKNLAEYLPR